MLAKKWNTQKTNYNLIDEGTLNLVYTGQASHASSMIRILEENVNFSKLSFKIKLTLICRDALKSQYFEIENLPFDLKKMSSRMIASDMGIYAVDDNEYNHGKLAMKSLEYASCQLPQIASSIGLSPSFEESKDYISLDTKNNWNIILENLYNDADKRKTIAGRSFKKVKENHSIATSYEAFKKIMELSIKN